MRCSGRSLITSCGMSPALKAQLLLTAKLRVDMRHAGGPGSGPRANDATRIAREASAKANVSGSQLDHTLAAVAHEAASRAHAAEGNAVVAASHRRYAEVHLGKARLTTAADALNVSKRDQTPLHAAADKHVAAFTLALRAAFNVARKALKGSLRAAGDVEGHEFHGNQWTTGGAGVFPSADIVRPFNVPNDKNHEALLKDLFSNKDPQQVALSKNLKAYINGTGYVGVNARLREDPSSLTNVEQDLNNLLSSTKMSSESVLYRGVEGLSENDFKPGTTITMNGFQSFSRSPLAAADFAYHSEGGKSVVFEAIVSRGLDLGSRSVESEVLVAHGMQWRVYGAKDVLIQTPKGGSRTQRVVQIEQVTK